MGAWIRGLILSSFIIGILIGSLVDSNREAPSSESYWFRTGLSQVELFKFIEDDFCHSSDRYFMACVNALQQVSIRKGYIFTPDKGFEKTGTEKISDLSEKDLLLPWQDTLKKRTGSEMLVNFQDSWNQIEKKFLSKSETPMMIGVAMNGFLSVFRDPHTYIIPIDYYRQIVANSDYRSSSYGFVITRLQKSFYVKKVIPGSPSDMAGLRRGQQVLKINNWNLENMNLSALNDKIRSDGAQKIQIKIKDSHNRIQDFDLMKANQALSTVHLKILDTKTPTALLTLDRFTRKSCEKVKSALQEVREQGVRSLILDLRDNPGGQMDEAGCIAGLFTGRDKKIFSVKYLQAPARNDSYISEDERLFLGKIVVLINRGTASASEILAGVLREYNKAVLIGERTFGKGSFQEGDIWTLNSKVALFETKGFYFLPSGFSPQKMGLSPDLAVVSPNSGSREEGQYWNSLDLGHREPEPMHNGLPFESCVAEGQLAGSPEDPEITKAQQTLSCWGVAQVSGGFR